MRDLGSITKATCIERGMDGGAFTVLSPIDGQILAIIASWGLGWDHVSVSRKNRVPNWAEMEHVKRIFFKEDEVAVQYHVPPAEHVNIHPNVLHLWRPHYEAVPMPPSLFV